VTGPFCEESIVVPEIVARPGKGNVPMLTVVVQLPLAVCAGVILRVMDPLIADAIIKLTVADGSVVPEMTRAAACVCDTFVLFAGTEIDVAGEIRVSFFMEIVWERTTLSTESVTVAVKKILPSTKGETSITTLHVPTGEVDVVLEVTSLLSESESEPTTNTKVPGSANPLTVTLVSLAWEITNWKLVGARMETAATVSLLTVTVGEVKLFPKASVMLAMSLIGPSKRLTMEVVTDQVPSGATVTGEVTTSAVEVDPSTNVTLTLPPGSPVPCTRRLEALTEFTLELEAGTLMKTNVVPSFVKEVVVVATFPLGSTNLAAILIGPSANPKIFTPTDQEESRLTTVEAVRSEVAEDESLMVKVTVPLPSYNPAFPEMIKFPN